MRTDRLLVSVLIGTVALPACSSAPPRVVHVRALDSMRFDPVLVSVRHGERIRFVVVNEGALRHEFVVGDELSQSVHIQAMAEHRDDGPAHQHRHAHEPMLVLALDPGASREAVVEFDEPGVILFACHVDRHYEAGMSGRIAVL